MLPRAPPESMTRGFLEPRPLDVNLLEVGKAVLPPAPVWPRDWDCPFDELISDAFKVKS